MHRMHDRRRIALLALLFAALTACGAGKPKSAAEAGGATRPPGSAAVPQGPAADAVGLFHARLDAADFATIWADADPGFRSSVSRSDYDRFMTQAHARLGRVVRTVNLRSTPLRSADRSTLLLAQTTTFEHGTALETFTYLITPKGAVLLGYNLQSAGL